MRLRSWAVLACMLVRAGVAADTAQAAEAPPGASSCSGCHGLSASPETSVPTLAGRTAPEIAGIMREFKSTARPATVMGRIAKGFDDADIDAIAEWMARQGK